MSQDKILKSLTNLGLTKAEAKVYFYLAKRGPKKASEITNTLKMTRQQLYIVIKRLQSKAIVNSTIDRPARFSAVPLNKLLDLVAKSKIEEAKIIENNKGRLLSDWESISIPVNEDNTSKFTVIKGRKHVYSKIQQMILDTQSQISLVSNLSGLLRADHFGVLDVINRHPNRSQIQFRFVTEISHQDTKPIKHLIKDLSESIKVKARNTDIGLSLFPKMVIRDDEELLYFISPKKDQMENEFDYFSLLTNCTSIVKPFSTVFEDLWSNSTEIKQKINELETGKLPPRTLIINDEKEAKSKYEQAIKNARKEVFIVIPANRLVNMSKNMERFSSWKNMGVSVKIMSPIIGKNLAAAKELSNFVQIRHSPVNYLETAIIDGEHLFQFKNIEAAADNLDFPSTLENTFYSNDRERVTKTENILQSIWLNSSAPSAITIESVLGHPPTYTGAFASKIRHFKVYRDGKPSTFRRFPPALSPDVNVVDEKETDMITEKEVINRIVKTNREMINDSFPNRIIACCSIGFALVHPPSHFSLPDILIEVMHIDKKSTFGAEDALMIYFWLDTPMGFKYVPMAVVGDNPRGKMAWKVQTQGTPAEKNYHLIEKDQIQIQVYGNTLFAEWTMPIKIVPGKYTLPPAAILLKAYGKIRTHSFSTVLPSNVRNSLAFNYFQAFVTLIHNASEYTGPGTDGLFIRDGYIETILP
jgi:sugar-specific transcriptional regulator TrmB